MGGIEKMSGNGGQKNQKKKPFELTDFLGVNN